MGSVTVKVAGLAELEKRMQTLALDMQNKIARAATAAGAVVIKNAAIRNAPRDTGNLAKNIIAKRLPRGEAQHTSEHIVTVRKGKLTAKQKATGMRDAYYGGFVEFGTVHTAPRPYLRPAYDQNKTQAVEAMKSRIEARLKKAGA